jgi:anti-anti-sigma factor
MRIAISNGREAGEIRLTLPERFDFSLHREFRQLYEQEPAGGTRYVVDLRDTQYVDSAGLGMLLQLWEHAGRKADRVRLVNAQPTVRDILQIANFQQLMQVG